MLWLPQIPKIFFICRREHTQKPAHMLAKKHFTDQNSLLCIQSSRGSCQSGWTTFSSRFSLGPLTGRGRGDRKSHKGHSDRPAVSHQEKRAGMWQSLMKLTHIQLYRYYKVVLYGYLLLTLTSILVINHKKDQTMHFKLLLLHVFFSGHCCNSISCVRKAACHYPHDHVMRQLDTH